jgi:hypothetical protein
VRSSASSRSPWAELGSLTTGVLINLLVAIGVATLAGS